MRTATLTALIVVVLGALTAAVASAVRPTDTGAGVPTAPAASRAAVPAPAPAPAPGPVTPRPGVGTGPTAPSVAVRAKPSRAVGRATHGRLVRGVLLPAEGPDHTTWDPIEDLFPNRDWRRVGTDRLVATLMTVAAEYRARFPGAPRIVISDLSLPQGGRFGPEYGGLGHASHQNGLDVDIAYPRADRREIGVQRVGQIDRRLSQGLVDAFVRAGAEYVFVGPRTRLRGPRWVVQPLVHHDDHLHLRIPNVR